MNTPPISSPGVAPPPSEQLPDLGQLGKNRPPADPDFAARLEARYCQPKQPVQPPQAPPQVEQVERVETAAAPEPGVEPLEDAPAGIRGAFELLDRAWKRYQKISNELAELHKKAARGEIQPDDPELAFREAELMNELFTVQMLVQRGQFGVELMSKVVEHGTGGMRTVLQTQA